VCHCVKNCCQVIVSQSYSLNIMSTLLNLPGEILVNVLIYTKHDDLFSIATVHPRLAQVLRSSSLWKHVNFENPASLQQLKKAVKYMGNHTKSVKITGFLKGRRPILKSNLSSAFLKNFKETCTSLKCLTLQHILIDSKVCNFTTALLPEKLEHLELIHCDFTSVMDRERVFCKDLRRLPYLTELSIAECNWLSLLDLIICSLHPTLTKISFTKCGVFSVDAHDSGQIHSILKQQESARKTEKIEESPLHLCLDDCGIEDRTLAHLDRVFVRVNRLGVAQNPSITSRGLAILTSRWREDRFSYEVLKLVELDLTGISVSSNTVQEARNLLPSCKINFC